MNDYPNLSDTEIFAKTLWGEARGEGIIGMLAVACVIKNRANKAGWWGNNIRTVCLKPFQFSCWLSSDPNLPKMLAVNESDKAYSDAMKIAKSSLDLDITNGADSYYAKGTPIPVWAVGRSPVATIGDHIFYKTVS